MNPSVFRGQYRVTYADCTVGNHVFHARYLDILDRVRGDFFRTLNQPLLALQEADVILPVVECRIRYKAMARYDDDLVVEIRVLEVARVQLKLGYRVLNQAQAVLLEAEITYACTGVQGRLQRLPEALGNALRARLVE